MTVRPAGTPRGTPHGDRLEAALAEARRPWLAKVLEGLRRRAEPGRRR